LNCNSSLWSKAKHLIMILILMYLWLAWLFFSKLWLMTSQVEDKHKYTVDTLPGRSITLGFWYWLVGFCLMVFNASSNNFSFISWRSVLLMEKIGVPRENHRPAASHWQTLSHNVVWLEVAYERDWNSQL
jgi:hypothetical protein